MKEQDNIFYVYAHYRVAGRKKNEIFYVGKGCGNRSTTKKDRNKYWHNIVNKYDYYVEILYDNLDEQTAFSLEIATIARYGRKDLKLGPLVNLSDGGDGNSGLIHSDESKAKIGAASKGGNNPQARPVKNHLGMRFDTIAEAEEWSGGIGGVGACCRGACYSSGRDPKTGQRLQWKYEDDLTPFTDIEHKDKPIRNQFGDVFLTMVAAAEWCGIKSSSCIGKACSGESQTSGNHPLTGQPVQWKYSDDLSEFEEIISWEKEVINHLGDTFPTLKEAAEWCGLSNSSSVLGCCAGTLKTAGKHPETNKPLQWRYKNSKIPFDSKKDIESGKSVINQFGDIFQTAEEAAAWCGLSCGSSISICCKGKVNYAGKHPITKEKLTWKLVRDL